MDLNLNELILFEHVCYMFRYVLVMKMAITYTIYMYYLLLQNTEKGVSGNAPV